ncbi:fatty acid cis/trans isomerase, partial [Microbacteriaceae bacterium K1510]|nr:fatty acid cis/trans isomerase [Microbacteriaceae bacterium K1510]
LEEFSQMAAGITSSRDYERLVDRFGIRRTSPDFWEVYDRINAIGLHAQPTDDGVLDLTRYELAPH